MQLCCNVDREFPYEERKEALTGKMDKSIFSGDEWFFRNHGMYVCVLAVYDEFQCQ